nr:hypothetical protein [Tanacetum cinerariifolium]
MFPSVKQLTHISKHHAHDVLNGARWCRGTFNGMQISMGVYDKYGCPRFAAGRSLWSMGRSLCVDVALVTGFCKVGDKSNFSVCLANTLDTVV